ncbi:MAG: hypothetical protein H6823_22750 [Planctomycetaceae bacterium]|nr:hypothetical protein [Planctomycetales bacterium]MCB9941062.1 hypothetical protein [Planctomycetaceae bacterium]
MRSVMFGVLSVACLIGIVVGSDAWRDRLHAQQPAAHPQGELIALNSDVEEGRQQIVVIDPKSRVMSVYHIEHATGVISLKSVRNIHADLLMDEFNTDSPLPKEIRAILDQR